ncbi:glutaredoxin family protein [Endozoicomonas sp.]|uniref:glutaredoxin family protein n=1 Tax=Endozoicomonas sp. TaxID=1892382 RepID=UPI002885E862|nr:glutaredoxin family protein [Endozoicomonas sp.]
MIKLTLYTTAGCHLCEEAEQMLHILSEQQLCQWQPLEICDHDDLVNRYGIRIPVIATGQGREIGWPFTLESLYDWLNQPISG